MEKNIIDKIINTHADRVLIKYYPYIDNFKNIIDIKDITYTNNLDKYLKKCRNIKEQKYSELSINDKYVEIHDTGNKYYKKQLYIYIPDIVKGVYILELLNKCDSYCIPHIVDYHSNIMYEKKIYQYKDIDICYNTVNNKTYLEINKTIDTNNLEISINNFTNHIDELIKNNII